MTGLELAPDERMHVLDAALRIDRRLQVWLTLARHRTDREPALGGERGQLFERVPVDERYLGGIEERPEMDPSAAGLQHAMDDRKQSIGADDVDHPRGQHGVE